MGTASTATQQEQIIVSGDLTNKRNGFASYQRVHADTDIASGGLLSNINNLEVEGWAADLQRKNIFSGGDRLQIMAHQKTSIRRGEATIQHSVAEGYFVQSFYGGQMQTIRQQNTVINLAIPVQTSWIIGYAMEPNKKTELAFGVEQETSTNGLPFQYE